MRGKSSKSTRGPLFFRFFLFQPTINVLITILLAGVIIFEAFNSIVWFDLLLRDIILFNAFILYMLFIPLSYWAADQFEQLFPDIKLIPSEKESRSSISLKSRRHQYIKELFASDEAYEEFCDIIRKNLGNRKMELLMMLLWLMGVTVFFGVNYYFHLQNEAAIEVPLFPEMYILHWIFWAWISLGLGSLSWTLLSFLLPFRHFVRYKGERKLNVVDYLEERPLVGRLKDLEMSDKVFPESDRALSFRLMKRHFGIISDFLHVVGIIVFVASVMASVGVIVNSEQRSVSSILSFIFNREQNPVRLQSFIYIPFPVAVAFAAFLFIGGVLLLLYPHWQIHRILKTLKKEHLDLLWSEYSEIERRYLFYLNQPELLKQEGIWDSISEVESSLILVSEMIKLEDQSTWALNVGELASFVASVLGSLVVSVLPLILPVLF